MPDNIVKHCILLGVPLLNVKTCYRTIYLSFD